MASLPRHSWVVALFVGFTPVVSVRAEESLHERIDKKIAAGLENYDQVASPVAGHAEFLRRVTLDLTGRIPSSAETRAFLADNTPDKRTRLIDRLLASPEHARRMQEYFDVALLDRRADIKVPQAEWEEFLRSSFAANKPYDQLVREVLSSDGADPKTSDSKASACRPIRPSEAE